MYICMIVLYLIYMYLILSRQNSPTFRLFFVQHSSLDGISYNCFKKIIVSRCWFGYVLKIVTIFVMLYICLGKRWRICMKKLSAFWRLFQIPACFSFLTFSSFKEFLIGFTFFSQVKNIIDDLNNDSGPPFGINCYRLELIVYW